jgi:hypothetical protein
MSAERLFCQRLTTILILHFYPNLGAVWCGLMRCDAASLYKLEYKLSVINTFPGG